MLVACRLCGRRREVAVEGSHPFCAPCKKYAAILPLLKPPGEWVEDAVCAQTDPEVFFPPRSGGAPTQEADALRVCAGCPVREQCLQYSIETRQWWGIWGGVSQRKRRKMLKELAA